MTPIRTSKVAVDGFVSIIWVLEQFQAISLPNLAVIIVNVIAGAAAIGFLWRYGMPLLCKAFQRWIDVQVKALGATRSGLDAIITAPAALDRAMMASPKKIAVALRWAARAISRWLNAEGGAET